MYYYYYYNLCIHIAFSHNNLGIKVLYTLQSESNLKGEIWGVWRGRLKILRQISATDLWCPVKIPSLSRKLNNGEKLWVGEKETIMMDNTR